MIDFDHSISNSSSHESNNLNSDFIGSKRSEDSEEIFKDDEFEDSESKGNDEDGDWEAETSATKGWTAPTTLSSQSWSCTWRTKTTTG